MSISASLANALSGLTATARSAEVVSSNTANALTDGYGRREIVLTSAQVAGTGAGVRVVDVLRSTDRFIIGERRLADADMSRQQTLSDFFTRMQVFAGQPDQAGSLTGRVSALESALIQAASRPDSDSRLQGVVDTASRLATGINDLSDQIQNLRMEADQSIDAKVARLNQGLAQVQEINVRIMAGRSSGVEVNTLMDHRQQIIDELSQIVPLRTADRQGGQVALYTTGGAILLDGQAATVGFGPVGVITPDMTLASGALSGLTLNGNPVNTTATGPLGGGSLGATFEVRDDHAPTAQATLDAVARDLIERFADPSVDPSLAPGDPGLFTDAGTAFLPADEVGLAARIEINAAVDPAQGGAVWRIRDGLNAAAPGNVGFADLINALSDALTASRAPASGPMAGIARSASGLAGELMTDLNNALSRADAELGFVTAQRDTLKTAELQNGVDTDQEMQKLLLIEQAYAANARVISAADDMLQQLLGL